MLKVVLIGYGEIASALMLGILESQHKLVGVLRWEKVETNKFLLPFKDFFLANNFTSLIKANKVHELNARSANSEQFRKEIIKLETDVIIIGSWGEILKKESIIIPKIACVNCHPSLLPKYRGSNPYTSAIKYGETKSGITFHLVDEGIDTGPILLQKEVDILQNDTGGSLRLKCSYQAKEAVKELLNGLENAMLLPQKQDESKASYYPRISEKDAFIDWKKPAQEIHDQIRAHDPWMKCYVQYKNQFILIKSSKLIKLSEPVNKPGKILDKGKKSLVISTGDPNKAVQICGLKIYGFASDLWSDFYIDNKIKIGDFVR